MTRPTHIFFDLHGTVIDNINVLPPLYGRALGYFMAERYGGDPQEWTAANQRVVADWANYFADLDLDAEDGLDQWVEGLIRTTRALFRLTGRPYPPPEEVRAVVDAMHYAVTSRCDAIYPDAREALVAVCDLPLTAGMITNGLHDHTVGLLVGAGVRECFTGPIITPTVAGYLGKDEGYFRLALGAAACTPAQAIMVDDRPPVAALAAGLGMRVVLVDRGRGGLDAHRVTVIPDLRGLPSLLAGWLNSEEGGYDHG
jgi:FMN phosphatase YigB (HAD superfamily)